jgi:hypothetical protein
MFKLPKKQVEKVKEIFLRVYGVELTDDETAIAAERILNLVALFSMTRSTKR